MEDLHRAARIRVCHPEPSGHSPSSDREDSPPAIDLLPMSGSLWFSFEESPGDRWFVSPPADRFPIDSCQDSAPAPVAGALLY